MDLKRVRRKSARKSKELGDAEERGSVAADSGLSSASSSDILDRTDFPQNFEVLGKVFLPVVILNKSMQVENLISLHKQSYLQALQLCENSRYSLTKSVDAGNITGKNLVTNSPINGCFTKMGPQQNETDIDWTPTRDLNGSQEAKYNLRVHAKNNMASSGVRKKILRERSGTGSSDCENTLQNIKITASCSTQGRVVDLVPFNANYASERDKKPKAKKRQRKLSRNTLGDVGKVSKIAGKPDATVKKRKGRKIRRRRSSAEKRRLERARWKRRKIARSQARISLHKKVWKRFNDTPSDIVSVSSDCAIFRDAVLDLIELARSCRSNAGSVYSADLSDTLSICSTRTPIKLIRTSSFPSERMHPININNKINTPRKTVRSATSSVPLGKFMREASGNSSGLSEEAAFGKSPETQRIVDAGETSASLHDAITNNEIPVNTRMTASSCFTFGVSTRNKVESCREVDGGKLSGRKKMIITFKNSTVNDAVAKREVGQRTFDHSDAKPPVTRTPEQLGYVGLSIRRRKSSASNNSSWTDSSLDAFGSEASKLSETSADASVFLPKTNRPKARANQTTVAFNHNNLDATINKWLLRTPKKRIPQIASKGESDDFWCDASSSASKKIKFDDCPIVESRDFVTPVKYSANSVSETYVFKQPLGASAPTLFGSYQSKFDLSERLDNGSSVTQNSNKIVDNLKGVEAGDCFPNQMDPKQTLFKVPLSRVRGAKASRFSDAVDVTGNSECGSTCDLREILVNKRKGVFKAPPLPLSRRPPTRITPEMLQIRGGKSPSQSSIPLAVEKDLDTISLFAESSISEVTKPDDLIHSKKSPKHNVHTFVNDEEQPAPKETERPNSQPLIELPKQESESQKSTIQNEPPAPETFTCPEKLPSEKDTSKVEQWFAFSSNVTVPVIPDRNLHKYLGNICRHYSSLGKCHYPCCKFMHGVPADFSSFLAKLTQEQFKKAYTFLIQRSHLFSQTFLQLVDCLKDQERALVDMVSDVVKINKFEKKPYVVYIISALQNWGHSFVTAINEILLARTGTEEWLLDILLDLAVNEEGCVENNWDLVKKLTDGRNCPPDEGVIIDILTKCVNADPPNEEFCKNVCRDLILPKKIDLFVLVEKEREKFVKYINLLRKFNLTDYARQLKETYHITVSEAETHPPKPCGSIDYDENKSNFSNRFSTSSESSARSESTDYSERCAVNSVLGVNGVGKPLTYSFARDFSPPKETNINQPYEPFAADPNVAEYVPTQPLAIFKNSLHPVDQNCSYKSEESSEEYEQLRDNCVDAIVRYPSAEILTGIGLNVKGPLPRCIQHYQGYTACSKSTSPSLDKTSEVPSSNDDMSNEDIIKLTMAIKNKYIPDILSLMQKYSESDMSKSFVVHLISGLKTSVSPEMSGYIIAKIFSELENLHHLSQSLPANLLQTLQLFGLNILPVLDKNRQYKVASVVFNKFASDLPGFLDTKCIVNFDYLSTPHLRYFFVFKLFTRDDRFREALKLLKSPELKLYEDLFLDETTDTYSEYKKKLVCEFIEVALKSNLPVVKDTIHFLMFNVKCDRFPELQKYLNLLIINMLNQYSEYRIDILGFFENIIHGWYKYLYKGVLRALFIQLYNELSDRKILEFYQTNVSLDVYEAHEGIGNCIKIPSDLLKEEIYVSLHLYFHNICKNNFPMKNIIIEIKPVIKEEPENSTIAILTNSRTTAPEMKNRVLNVLNKLPNPPASYEESDYFIVLPYNDVQLTLALYRSERLPPLIKFR